MGSPQNNGDIHIPQEVEDFINTQRYINLLESDILSDNDDIQQHQQNQSQHQPSIPTIHPSKKNMIPQIFFATHNINGIRQDQSKLDRILSFSAEHNIDVLVLTETNLLASAKRFININTSKFGYISYWSEASDKIKGSGVGILIADHLAKYIHKVDVTSVPHYTTKVSLCFKGCYLQIYGIYYPPSDRTTQQSILKYIKQEHLINKKHLYYHSVILGDFNSVIDSSLDKSGNFRFYKQPSSLITSY